MCFAPVQEKKDMLRIAGATLVEVRQRYPPYCQYCLFAEGTHFLVSPWNTQENTQRTLEQP